MLTFTQTSCLNKDIYKRQKQFSLFPSMYFYDLRSAGSRPKQVCQQVWLLVMYRRCTEWSEQHVGRVLSAWLILCLFVM